VRRSAALAPLSRDHHHALDAARRLRHAEGADVAAAVAHFLAFFRADGERHFAIEEAHLLGALPSEDAEWAAAVERVRSDHAEIRAGARALAAAGDAPGAAEVRALGTRLHDHVRFEERHLFALLEERLGADELDALGRRVLAAEG
jgi:hypothetical protein